MQENVPDLTVPNLDCSGRQYALSGKCCWRPAENIHGSSSGKMCPVPCHRTKERILKLSSTNYYTSESLPEVEQISLFSNMASGGGFANYGAVAYRIVNAQWWGIPQRRRRVYAVCDTRRESAGVVVFERKGTEWNFEPCIPQGEGVTGLTTDCYSWHDRMVATKPCGGGQREAYTMKIRSGCDGGGKGPLVQEELSATLATHQDQTLFELRNTVLNDQGGGFMEVTHGMTGTLRAQEHGHAPITFDKTEGNEKT